MKRRSAKKIWLTVGLTHAALVLLGAFQINLGHGLVRELATIYGKFSGSTSGYAFFAPGVGSTLRATFNVIDEKGAVLARVPLEQGKNHEADLRVGNMIGWFWKDNPKRELQRSMTASWAAKIFARYPRAAAIEVVLEEFQLPDMDRYRAGERPTWTKYYSAKFKKAVAKKKEA